MHWGVEEYLGLCLMTCLVNRFGGALSVGRPVQTLLCFRFEAIG